MSHPPQFIFENEDLIRLNTCLADLGAQVVLEVPVLNHLIDNIVKESGVQHEEYCMMIVLN